MDEGSSITCEACEASCSSTVMPDMLSFVSYLRSPQLSDLVRKRKVKFHPLVGKKLRKQTKTDSDPKSVSPALRVRELPEQSLTVSSCKLFCSAYHVELGLKAITIHLHIKSQRHQNGRESCM